MRSVEDILKDMEELGLSPDSIDADILKMQKEILEQVVSIDEKMSDEQVRGAFRFMNESHKRRPIEQPVSITVNGSGGVVLNRGNITKMSPAKVAEKHKQKLDSKDPSALRINHLLLKVAEETG